MRWILAALVLLVAQQAAWRQPALPVAPVSATDAHAVAETGAGAVRPVEALLEGGRSTPSPVELVGRVVDVAPTFADGARLTVDVETADGEAVRGLVSVSLREATRRWRTGDRLALRSRLRRIAGFGNFGELDWPAYNARRGILLGASAWSADDVQAMEPRDGFVDRVRRRFAEACEALGGQGAEILEALVIGDRTGIDRATNLAVRDAGLAHFLAISGSHMALVVALVVGAVKRGAGLVPRLMETHDVMRPAALLGAAAVAAYGAVCGGGVSVLRSELMALAAMAALWRGRPGDDLRALGGSAIVLALAMPGVGEEAGFQLSYLAVLALVLDARRRREAAHEAAAGSASPTDRTPPSLSSARLATMRDQGLRLLLEAARMTLVCWAVTSPVVAFHFQRLSLLAPLANLLAAPLVSAIVVSGLAGLVLLPWSAAAGGLAVRLGAFLSDLVLRVAAWCASLPMAATATVNPGAALAATLTALALLALAPPRRGRRVAALALAVTAAGLVAVGVRDRWRDDRLDVWFASVGQGDAAIVRMPGGAVWVIDQGPPGRGRMVLGPLLRRAWIGRIDVLAASHVQSDHAGAMAEILEDFEVGEVWLPDGPCDSPAASRLRGEAAARGVPLRFASTEGLRDGGDDPPGATPGAISLPEGSTAQGGNRPPSPSVSLRPPAGSPFVQVLGPSPGAAPCHANDGSLLLSVAFAGRRVLFTGDAEARAESAATGRGPVNADVLKVAHHGSRTSSTAAFLEAVSPRLAVISVGLDNSFRHPAPDVLARYEARGIRVLRTDRDGAIHLTIAADGKVTTEMFRREQEKEGSDGAFRRSSWTAGN